MSNNPGPAAYVPKVGDAITCYRVADGSLTAKEWIGSVGVVMRLYQDKRSAMESDCAWRVDYSPGVEWANRDAMPAARREVGFDASNVRPATPAECRAAGLDPAVVVAWDEPVAWAAMNNKGEFATIHASREDAIACWKLCEPVALYRHPAPTPSAREVAPPTPTPSEFMEWAEKHDKAVARVVALEAQVAALTKERDQARNDSRVNVEAWGRKCEDLLAMQAERDAALRTRLAAAEARVGVLLALLARCRFYVCTIPVGMVDPASDFDGDQIAYAIDVQTASLTTAPTKPDDKKED